MWPHCWENSPSLLCGLSDIITVCVPPPSFLKRTLPGTPQGLVLWVAALGVMDGPEELEVMGWWIRERSAGGWELGGPGWWAQAREDQPRLGSQGLPGDC